MRAAPVADGMAPQSLVTPMGSFTLVANVLFAHFWLKEPVGRTDIVVSVRQRGFARIQPTR